MQKAFRRHSATVANQQEVLNAFDDLVLWVTEGTRPADGDTTVR